MDTDDLTATDGNGLARLFADAFDRDVTSSRTTCATCHRESVFAEGKVYGRLPGVVVRCTHCTAVLIRAVQSPDRVWLDLRGVACWTIPTQS